jgi:hypothetical protein
MFVLHIEHKVSDYDRWKAAFDADPADRKGSGVHAFTVSREVTDPNRVAIDLGFADEASARAMLDKLQGVWDGMGPGLLQGLETRIFDMVEQGSP